MIGEVVVLLAVFDFCQTAAAVVDVFADRVGEGKARRVKELAYGVALSVYYTRADAGGGSGFCAWSQK